MQRPPLPRLAWYALGFKLPDRYDDWVFHDLNDRGWRVRGLVRIVAVAVPFVLGALLLPGAIALRATTGGFILVGPLFIGVAYSDEFRAYRLRQHGLLPPAGPDPD